MPPKFLEHVVILCFEGRFSKQNSVIRLKSKILAPPKNFLAPPNSWAGYATDSRPPKFPSAFFLNRVVPLTLFFATFFLFQTIFYALR